MTTPVAWLLTVEVDVGRDNTVEIAPTDDHAKHDGALQGAFDVIVDPRDSIRDRGIDSYPELARG